MLGLKFLKRQNSGPGIATQFAGPLVQKLLWISWQWQQGINQTWVPFSVWDPGWLWTVHSESGPHIGQVLMRLPSSQGDEYETISYIIHCCIAFVRNIRLEKCEASIQPYKKGIKPFWVGAVTRDRKIRALWEPQLSESLLYHKVLAWQLAREIVSYLRPKF